MRRPKTRHEFSFKLANVFLVKLVSNTHRHRSPLINRVHNYNAIVRYDTRSTKILKSKNKN